VEVYLGGAAGGGGSRSANEEEQEEVLLLQEQDEQGGGEEVDWPDGVPSPYTDGGGYIQPPFRMPVDSSELLDNDAQEDQQDNTVLVHDPGGVVVDYSRERAWSQFWRTGSRAVGPVIELVVPIIRRDGCLWKWLLISSPSSLVEVTAAGKLAVQAEGAYAGMQPGVAIYDPGGSRLLQTWGASISSVPAPLVILACAEGSWACILIVSNCSFQRQIGCVRPVGGKEGSDPRGRHGPCRRAA
jgi:hypothetical protein